MTFWPGSIEHQLTLLKHACRLNPDVLPESTAPDFEFDYIDIGNVTLEQGVAARERMTFVTAPSRARKPVQGGDVIVSTVRTYLKAVAAISPRDHGSIVSTGFAVLRTNSHMDPRFLYRVIQSNPFVEAVLAASVGVSYPAINPSTLASIKIPLPHLDTQRAIATFLDRETARIDQLIQKKERQAQVLGEREEATFLGIVTGAERAGPKASSGVDWIGDLPRHWRAPKFTHVARQETGHTPSRKEDAYWVPEGCVIPWFSLADVWQIRNGGQVYVGETAEKISQIGMENSAARLLPAETVILSRTASVGFAAILAVPMATTQDFAGWICSDRVRPKFLYYVLRSMKPVFRRLMMGSTHQTIYMPDIRSFRMPLPPVVEQDEIVLHLDRVTNGFRAAAVKITESVEKLWEHRSALITAAVTGQIDVRVQAAAVSTKPDRTKFRVLVGAEIVYRHRDTRRFGRIKNQKLLFLAEAHAGISELDGNYIRFAAGPYDDALIRETERGLEAAAFCRAQPSNGDSRGVIYVPLAKAGQHANDLQTLLGERADALRKLIDLLHDIDTETVEAIATLYAVWNDALMDGGNPDDATIIRGVLTEWHRDKEKFKEDELRHWLAWMRRNGLIPRGQGPRTAHTMTPDMFS